MKIKANDGSYLHNIYLKRRKDDPSMTIFYGSDEAITCRINGYAIIPLEEYANLTGEDLSVSIEKAREFDKLLED